MILPIYTYGMPVLRKESVDITPDYPDLKQLIADMFERVWEQTNHEVCKIYKTQSINDL